MVGFGKGESTTSTGTDEGEHWITMSPRGPGATHVILIRHGQSENNVIESEFGDTTDFYARRCPDPKLSALGHQQAFLVGERLGSQLKPAAEAGCVRILCSTMMRAMQTAAPLAHRLQVRCI